MANARLILPGQPILIYGNHVKPRNQKYFALSEGQIRATSHASRPDQRGVGHRHERGTGMRWTRMEPVTTAPDAYGEDVWS